MATASKTELTAKFTNAIVDTTARFQQNMMVRATWKMHVFQLLCAAERFGVRQAVENNTRVMRARA